MAAEVALHHRLTWQLRHLTFEPGYVAGLAASYQRGEPWQEELRPCATVEENTRKVDSSLMSRLLNLRYLAPARFRELCAEGVLPLSDADVLFLNGKGNAAIQGYRDQIAGSAVPKPEAWIGLALSLHGLPESPLRETFSRHLALLFDIFVSLGGHCDPTDLASWLG
jgi:hypothetical protein